MLKIYIYEWKKKKEKRGIESFKKNNVIKKVIKIKRI